MFEIHGLSFLNIMVRLSQIQIFKLLLSFYLISFISWLGALGIFSYPSLIIYDRFKFANFKSEEVLDSKGPHGWTFPPRAPFSTLQREKVVLCGAQLVYFKRVFDILVLKHVGVDKGWLNSRHVSSCSPSVFRCEESPRYHIWIECDWTWHLTEVQTSQPCLLLMLCTLKIQKKWSLKKPFWTVGSSLTLWNYIWRLDALFI